MTEEKNINTEWYNGTEDITIKASEYVTYKTAIEQAVQALSTVQFPEVREFILLATGEVVDDPTPEQIENREVAVVVSPEKTFTEENMLVLYDGKITQEMLMARELSLNIHARNVALGITKPISELEAERQGSKLELV
jgi:hypothetical protein